MAELNMPDAVMDAIASLVVVLDREGVIVQFNRACEQFSGWSREEVLRRPAWEAMTPPDRVLEDKERFRQLLDGPFPVAVESFWLTRDGSRRRISWSCDAVRDVEGTPRLIVCTGAGAGVGAGTSNIPMSSVQIKQADVWFHKVIETAHEGIGIIDAEGLLTYVNPRLAEMVGYPIEQIVGRKFYEFQVNPPKLGERRLADRKAGKSDSYEVQLRRKDGSLIWVLMNANPLLNEAGELVASLGMAFDINDRRAAEAALHESEERFRLAVELSPDMMFYQDLDLQFTWISKTVPPIRKEDVVGHCDYDVIDLEQGRMVVALKTRVLQTGVPERMDNCVDIGGKTYHFETLIVRRVDAGGRPIGVAGYCRDVTERKLAEQAIMDLNATLERRVSERTESLMLSEAVSRRMAEHNRLLVQEVEHRVGNNIAGILGLLSVMRDRTRDVDAFAESIAVRLRGMAHVHQMLKRSGWNAVDLRSLVESTLAAVRDTSCHGTQETLDGPDIEVAAKYVHALTLILLELYTNSCKYGAHSVPGGKLAIRWAIQPTETGDKIQLAWREIGGPAIAGAVTSSLGTQLVRLFATKELNGRCELTFPPSGAEHLIEFPVVPPN